MHNQKGVSLLENLIAVIILMLVMFGLVGIFISGRAHIAHSRSLVSGAELAKYYLSPWQMQVRQDQWATNCLGTKNVTACSGNPSFAPLFQAQDIHGVLFTPAYTISDAPGTTIVRKVKLTVTWNE